MGFCPQCGTEYRRGYTECYDCQVALIDEPPPPPLASGRGDGVDPELVRVRLGTSPVEVFRSGRHIEAELVRARLEGSGVTAMVWSGGMGPWRVESSLTEMTGVPNDFNAHRVMVARDDEEEARSLLEEVPVEEPEEWDEDDEPRTALQWLRTRGWIVSLAFSLGIMALLNRN